MLMVDLLQWWYVKGWSFFSIDFKTKLRDTADTFSIGELLRTLFKPYKQISAGVEATTVDSKVNVFFDKLISRLVGLMTRLVLILAGTIMLLLELIIGGILLAVWPLIPFMPIAGIILVIVGVPF